MGKAKCPARPWRGRAAARGTGYMDSLVRHVAALNGIPAAEVARRINRAIVRRLKREQ